ncbi:MAG: murein transglycosylase A [Alphaproteobacteria bacterium]|nr:murein transglycosylase A [Alphaproteobacteria bacterium]
MRFALLFSLLLLSACAGTPSPAPEAPLTLKKSSFSALPGWRQDRMAEALPALERSCARILKKDPSSAFGPLAEAGTTADWTPACHALQMADKTDEAALAKIIEHYFEPWEARAGTDPEGLFTGYYEASLRGSRTRHGPYRYPLHARPDDLVMVDLGEFREELKGQRIAGRVRGGNLKPYENRAQIVAGSWPHNDKVLAWVDDPVDAFFVQIQGSGVIELHDGKILRIGYAGQNGHPYYAIGKELIERGALSKENVSMQSIRTWLAAHPDQADAVMNTNKSYVFFEETKTEGAKGGEGTVLTPGRSLAVDRSKIPYGIPLWVDIAPPRAGEPPLKRLMVAQDTGGAIRGAVRGDVFWGYGDRAENMAGPMKSKGRYWLLLPRNRP